MITAADYAAKQSSSDAGAGGREMTGSGMPLVGRVRDFKPALGRIVKQYKLKITVDDLAELLERGYTAMNERRAVTFASRHKRMLEFAAGLAPAENTEGKYGLREAASLVNFVQRGSKGGSIGKLMHAICATIGVNWAADHKPNKGM